jgi:ribosomal protein S18 acetylase RimI-like enzyme
MRNDAIEIFQPDAFTSAPLSGNLAAVCLKEQRPMRLDLYQSSRQLAFSLLRRAPVVHSATTTPDGAPLLRALHPIVLDDLIAFHSAPEGEKVLALGRPAVISAEEIIAPIPSTFRDPWRACPATTFYLSAQVSGVLRPIEVAEKKAEVLTALMQRFQPEGGYAPISADDTLYRRALEKILIVGMPLTNVVGKAKLGQNMRPDVLLGVIDQLWRRGLEGDPRAISLVLEANPATPWPAFLSGPPGVRLHCYPSSDRAEEAATLVAGEYWNEGIPPRAIAEAHRLSSAWVIAEDQQGELIATARAVGDRIRHAYIFDVGVARPWRGQGVGQALFRLLLDHPVLRSAERIWLRTRDAQTFYKKFGFSERQRTSFISTEMVLQSSGALYSR